MAPRILLITSVRWPSAARLAGAFAECGCVVEALAPAGHVIARSRHLAAHYNYRPLRAFGALRGAIEASKPDWIVPCDDRAVAQLLRLYGQAKDAGETALVATIARSLGKPDNYAGLISRDAFLATARQIGVATPSTMAVGSEVELEKSLAIIGLPAVLKSDGSWGGDGVAVVRDRDEALRAWRGMARPPSRIRALVRAFRRRDAHCLEGIYARAKPALSIQEFIKGSPVTTAFAAKDGEMLAANHFEVLQTTEPGGPASVVSRFDCVQLDRAARLVARHFGLSGLHGLDYMRDETGAIYLIEINPRATQTSHLALGEGHDLPAALCAKLGSARPRPSVTEGRIVALFPQEWTRDPASAFLTTGYHDVPWSDPCVLTACLERATAPRSVSRALLSSIPGSKRVDPAEPVSPFEKGLEGSR